MCCRSILFALVLLRVIDDSRVLSQPVASPMVIGFERFARHGDLAGPEAGQLLLSELQCSACHATAHSDLNSKQPIDLRGVGMRLSSDWLRQYLGSPASTKPGTTMPDLMKHLDPTQKAKNVSALTAYLMDQRKPFPEIKASGLTPVPHEFWEKGSYDEGRKLYHQVGCVACHAARDDYEAGATTSTFNQLLESLDESQIKELGLANVVRPVPSIPLPELSEKYSLESLTHFLYDPSVTHPSARMPNMKLTPVEAADISRYLLGQHAVPRWINHRPAHAELSRQGRLLFETMGCVQCHRVDGLQSSRFAKPMDQLDWTARTSCVVESQGSFPHYPLDAQQIQALQLGVEQLAGSTQSIDSLMVRWNCFACHERNKRGGIGPGRDRFCETVGHIDLGDEGRLPPPLTNVGYKLPPESLKKVLLGKGDLRPHLRIRMPKYSSDIADVFSKQFDVDDHLLQDKPHPLKSDIPRSVLASAGQSLFDQGCVQCHPIRGESLPGIVGVDLANLDARVRWTWFRDFLLNPVSLKSRTRMPSFFAQGSPDPSLLNGQIEQQIESLWVYLSDGEELKLPKKIEQFRSQSFELTPTDKPIIFRTFLRSAGNHAIAVGFPDQVHLAFDAERIRLAEIWRGRFLDAQSTWFSRAAPVVDPLGTDRIQFSRSPEFAWLVQPSDAWPADHSKPFSFRGYSLDEKGVPTFRYELNGSQFYDHLAAIDPFTLQRSLRVESMNQRSEGLFMKVIDGKLLEAVDASTVRNEQGLSVRLIHPLDTISLRASEQQMEWILPIPPEGNGPIQIEYRWTHATKP